MLLKLLLLFIPATFLIKWLAPEQTMLLFLSSLIALIPASLYIEHNTDEISKHAGETLGGLLNATFGNMPELFIGYAILTMAWHDISVYGLLKSQIIGGILMNIIFVIAIAMIIGGVRRKLQVFSTISARNYISLLLIATIALVFPSSYLANHRTEGTDEAATLSLAIAVILIVIYACYLVFSMVTHRTEIESSVEIDRALEGDAEHGKKRPLAVVIIFLLAISVTAVLLSDILVSTIEPAAEAMNLSQAFMGVIVLGIIGNVSGLVTAVSAAQKDRMDLAFNVAIGSSVQQILFVIPVIVFMSYLVGPQPFDLAFPLPSAVIMILSVIIMGSVIADGQSHWLKGAQLLSVFAILVAVILMLT